MIEVRRATRRDLPAIHRVRESAAAPYPPGPRGEFEHQLWGPATRQGQSVLVASEGGGVVAYISYVERAVPDTGDFYIWHFGARPGMRGALAAARLLEAIRAEARRLGARRLVAPSPPGDPPRQATFRRAGYRIAYDFLDLRARAPFRFDAPAPSGIDIAPLRSRDANRLHALYHRCFRGLWNAAPLTAAEVRDLLGSPSARAAPSFLARRRGRPVAFAVNLARREGGHRGGELWSLGVLPGERRRGLGGHLLALSLDAHARQGAEWVDLRVASPNLTARRLYREAGFSLRGRVHLYACPA